MTESGLNQDQNTQTRLLMGRCKIKCKFSRIFFLSHKKDLAQTNNKIIKNKIRMKGLTFLPVELDPTS